MVRPRKSSVSPSGIRSVPAVTIVAAQTLVRIFHDALSALRRFRCSSGPYEEVSVSGSPPMAVSLPLSVTALPACADAPVAVVPRTHGQAAEDSGACSELPCGVGAVANTRCTAAPRSCRYGCVVPLGQRPARKNQPLCHTSAIRRRTVRLTDGSPFVRQINLLPLPEGLVLPQKDLPLKAGGLPPSRSGL